MGTKMEFKSSLPGYCPMRDLNKDFNSCGGPLYFTDWFFPNRPSYHKISSKDSADAYRGNDRDVLKQTMLEHEAIFKYQVYELHRLYRIQKDLMNEVGRREYCRNHTTGDASFTSSPLASRSTSEEIRKCGEANSSSARLSCVIDNHSSLKDFDGLASRPGKVRKKMFDLQLPADEYIDSEEEEHFDNDGASGEAQGVDLSGKPMLQLLDLQRNGCQNTIEINGGGAFPSMLEAGYSKSKEKVPISSKPMQAFRSKVNETRAFYLDDKLKEHQRKDGPVYDMRLSEISHKGVDSKHQLSPFHSGEARPQSLSLWENMNLNAVRCQLHPSSNTATSFHECSYSTSYNFLKDDNFNGVRTSSGSNEEEQSKQEKNPSTFSWLRVMPATWNEAENSGRFSKMEEVSFTQSQLLDSWNVKKISDWNLTHNLKSGSSTCSRKLLGFPIFEPKNSKSLSSALNDESPSRSSNGEAKDKCKAIEFYINLSDSEDGKQAIDLNSCFIADDERVVAETDLEFAAQQKNEENIIARVEAMEKNEDVVTMAAEAIVAISLLSCDHPSNNAAKILPEDSSGNPLNWFAKIVLCGGDELREEEEDEDFFERMTLRLTETNKEEHMPPPLVLKEAKVEERIPTKLLNRGQKGQTRRGRQQRDFQRDILPAVASLSRQKVNEDIQIFEGIMREIGHSLPSGLAARRNSKKNNCTSPPSRRRTIITTPAHTILGLDDMHLKGWGKTTRRPRRQRYAGGNPHHNQGQY